MPPNAIPAPYKFSRPRGGDGPHLKFAKVAPNRSHIAAEPQSPLQNHAHLPLLTATPAPQTKEMVALVTCIVFDLLDKHNMNNLNGHNWGYWTEWDEHWYCQWLMAIHCGDPQLGVPLTASTGQTKIRGAASVRSVIKDILTHSEKCIFWK